MWMIDRLTSLVSGLGTAKDKVSTLQFGLNLLDDGTLNTMHRSNWLARKIVDVIPNDMTREWRDWQADDAQIEAIETLEKSPLINLRVKVNAALQKARLFGGAAIYLGMRDRTPEQPLDVESVGKGDLLYIHVLTRREITAGEISYDVTSEFYGEPSYYQIVASQTQIVRVHPSRIVRFVGAEVLDERFSTNLGWGDSVLQVVYDAVLSATSVQEHVASLLPEAKSDVIYIPGLSEILRSPTTTKQLTERFTYANLMKSQFNMLLLEGDGQQGERWEQKQISFATLPEIISQYLQIAAGAADIPVTRLVGEAPKGLNATGESDLRNYYDNVAARQRTELAPALHRLDEVIIRSATGARDPAIYYEWAPLWGLSDTEKATIFKTKVDAVRSIAGGSAGQPSLIPIDALSEALINMIVEDGSLPGLQAAIDEFGTLAEQEEPSGAEAEAALTPPTPIPTKTVMANDAEPRTLYVRRDVVNAAELTRWAKAQGFTDIVTDLHVTIAYSTAPVDWFTVGTSWSDKLEIAAGGPRQMARLGSDGRYIALLITASELVWRNREIREAGASWDWPDYQPHISIQIGGNIDLDEVEPYQGKIVLGPEIFEEVRTGEE